MMKKLLMMIVAMMTALCMNAQGEQLNEISVAYGGGSNSDLVGSIYKGMFTGKQLKYWGPISFEYFHRLKSNDRWGFGAVATVSGCKWNDDDDAKTTFFSVMPAVKYNWSVKEYVSWYSKAAFGVMVASDSGLKDNETQATINWQVSFIGVEVGKTVRGFVELGTGEQGIILGGVRLKF